MYQKLFRNCPYAQEEISCYECTEYASCSRRKILRAKQRREEERRRRRNRNIVILVVILVAVFATANICTIASETTFFGDNKPDQTKTLSSELETEKDVVVSSQKPNRNMSRLELETSKIIREESKPVVTPQISAYEAGEIYFYEVAENYKVLMARVVYAESRGEIFEGKVAVAAVILNRFVSDDPFFNKTSIESIIMQSGQFADISWVTDEHIAEIPECMEAVEAACKGWDPTRKMFEDGAKYFYSPKYISEEAMKVREGVPTLTIGNHAFHNEFADVDTD